MSDLRVFALSSSILHKIEEVALPIVEAQDAFIVDISLRGERGGQAVELFIDTDRGVSTDLCAGISRELSRALDVAGVIRGRWHLIVSSPGIDRPLKFHRQYAHHVGRTLSVKHKSGDSVTFTEGELVQVDTESIQLRVSTADTVKLVFTDIVEAHVKAAW